MNVDKDIAAFYRQCYFQFGDSPQAFDWKSKESQIKRFQVLLKVADLNGKSVLDVGCGSADLYLYLRDQGIKCNYYGCDLVPEFIAEARRKTPGCFYQGDFMQVEFNRPFDYVMCSGMLNYMGGDCSRAFAALDKMFDLATEGMAVNFRSSLHQKSSGLHLLSYDPIQVLTYSVVRYGSRLMLDHSYLPHDFTLFVYKAGYSVPTER